MARSRRPVRNPSIPRLEWVAKTYPDWVWFYTVLGFFEATGMDDEEDVLWREAHTIRNRNESAHHDGATPQSLPDGLSETVDAMIVAAGNENTEYDRHLPWLANRINAEGKPRIKAIKKRIREVYPDFIDRSGEPLRATDFVASAGVTQEALDRAVALGQLITVDPIEVQRDESPLQFALEGLDEDGHWVNRAHDMSTNVYSLVEMFGSIARWAEGAGVNLDDYSADEAADAAYEWARTRPKDLAAIPGDIVYEFADGWTFQELKTKPQLEYEGDYLDHCVRGYKPSKIGVVMRIFSLRNPDGEPVATLEWMVEDEHVRQYYGLSNRLPEQDDVERAIEFRRNYIDENLLSPDNKLGQMGHGYQIPWGSESLDKSFAWEVWKQTGEVHSRVDALVNQARAHGLPPNAPTGNPGKRRKAKRKKTPEYKRLLDRSRRLWETYDAKPLKKNLVAFGTHVERMEKSSSLKVKTEARRAARAFNAEFRARGWKK